MLVSRGADQVVLVDLTIPLDESIQFGDTLERDGLGFVAVLLSMTPHSVARFLDTCPTARRNSCLYCRECSLSHDISFANSSKCGHHFKANRNFTLCRVNLAPKDMR